MSKLTYVVRENLVVRLSESKTYSSGEKIDLTDAEYELHAHQLETEAQYLARTQPTTSKGNK